MIEPGDDRPAYKNERKHQILTLLYAGDMTSREIADELELNIQLVCRLLHRYRKVLRVVSISDSTYEGYVYTITNGGITTLEYLDEMFEDYAPDEEDYEDVEEEEEEEEWQQDD